MHPTLSSIQTAREMLAKALPVTRLIPAPHLSKRSGKTVSLKLETELPTSSFKVRGALYTLALKLRHSPIEKVVAHSTGNHGAAVAYAAKALGVRAKIFLPKNCNPVKRARIASLGAEICENGRDSSDAFDYAMQECAASPGVFFLNDTTDPDLPSATGVIGLEILEQEPNTHAIYVPMGDTALIRGLGAAAKQISPTVKVIGVQAERAPSYYRSWKEGRVVTTDSCDTVADGLATRTPVQSNVDAIRALVDDVVLVSERELLRAVDMLLIEEHVVAEPAGAAPTAALLKSAPQHAVNVVLVVTGANIARTVLRQAIQTE
jgi:threonine dehydratase